MFGLLPLLANPLVFVVVLAAAAFGLVLHNLAQAWLAARMGDFTAWRTGFASLEPRVHLDIVGFVFLVLLGFGVPRSIPTRMRGSQEVWVALAGPGTLLVIALIYLAIGALLPRGYSLEGVEQGLTIAAGLMVRHAAVFIFPVPPLDGSRIVYALGGIEQRRFMDRVAQSGPLGFLIIFLVLSLTGILGAAEQGFVSLISVALQGMGI